MAFTTIDLLPGASEQIVFSTPSPNSTTTYYSAVDDAENGDGVYIECDESNNEDTSAGYCLTPG